MSKKNRKQRRENNLYWQSAALNSQRAMMYEQWLTSLAINRFKWLNLPSTCDERYLELILFTNGIATIAHPKKQKGVFYSTQASAIAAPNVYDNPIKWQSFGNNGWHFNVNNSNGVLVYDNRLRMPLLPQIKLIAEQLAKFDRALDMNLLHQSTPYVFTAPQERQLDLANLIKQVAGFEPIIAGYTSLGDLIDEMKKIDLGVPFIGEQLNNTKRQVWNDAYNLLGINGMMNKRERLVAAEVDALEQPADLMALDPLNARREAAKKLNERFGLNLKVIWNTDIITDKYNYEHNPIVRESASHGI